MVVPGDREAAVVVVLLFTTNLMAPLVQEEQGELVSRVPGNKMLGRGPAALVVLVVLVLLMGTEELEVRVVMAGEVPVV